MNKQNTKTCSMSKTVIEICLLSARGLPRQTLLKHQWYAVGWVDPTNKYCTNIDASGTSNPVWKTKFTTVIEALPDFFSREVTLHIEVHSREPVFLREKLQATASINLREFLIKHSKNSNKFDEDVGSFQLRKKNGKASGFIDVSFKVSEENGTSSSSFLGDTDGFYVHDNSSITLPTGPPPQGYTGEKAERPFRPSQNYHVPAARPYAHPEPFPINYPHTSVPRSSYPPAMGPSYPAPSNGGYIPNFLPQDNTQSTSYMNMPSSSQAGRGAGVGPGFAVGMGAGALAAGAVIYGGDLMSGFELPTGMSNHSMGLSIDPPF